MVGAFELSQARICCRTMHWTSSPLGCAYGASRRHLSSPVPLPLPISPHDRELVISSAWHLTLRRLGPCGKARKVPFRLVGWGISLAERIYAEGRNETLSVRTGSVMSYPPPVHFPITVCAYNTSSCLLTTTSKYRASI